MFVSSSASRPTNAPLCLKDNVAITGALSCTRNLKSLTLHSINFRDNVYYRPNETTNGHNEEFVEFCQVLQNHLKHIETFILEDAEHTFDLNCLHNIDNLHLVTSFPQIISVSVGASPFVGFPVDFGQLHHVAVIGIGTASAGPIPIANTTRSRR